LQFVIRALQVAGRGRDRDLRQRCVAPRRPARESPSNRVRMTLCSRKPSRSSAVVRDFILRWIRAIAAFDSKQNGTRKGKADGNGAHAAHHTPKRNLSKTTLQNKDLQGKFVHGCVLFVQHPSKNGRTHTVQSRSFVACAEVFGNCDLATEGGIPRSSR
jgi:hypothetical protein